MALIRHRGCTGGNDSLDNTLIGTASCSLTDGLELDVNRNENGALVLSHDVPRNGVAASGFEDALRLLDGRLGSSPIVFDLKRGDPEFVDAVLSAIDRCSPATRSRIVVASFWSGAIRGTLRSRKAESVALGLSTFETAAFVLFGVRPDGARKRCCFLPTWLWTPAMVRRCHDVGMRAYAFTANCSSTVEHLVAMGLDGIVANDLDSNRRRCKQRPRLRCDPCVAYGIYLVLRYARDDPLLFVVGLAIVNQHALRDFTVSIPRPLVVLGALAGFARGVQRNDALVYGPMLYSLLSKFAPHTFDAREQFVVVLLVAAATVGIAVARRRSGRFLQKNAPPPSSRSPEPPSRRRPAAHVENEPAHGVRSRPARRAQARRARP